MKIPTQQALSWIFIPGFSKPSLFFSPRKSGGEKKKKNLISPEKMAYLAVKNEVHSW
jgi:hypothetical protein